MASRARAFHSGNIYTVSDTSPRAQAFIISSGGFFTTVGSNDEIIAQARRAGLPEVDLQGRFVMPGIHDAHAHLLTSGLAILTGVSIGHDAANENLCERINSPAFACQCPGVYGDWLLGDTMLVKDFDRKHLDAAFPDTPVAIRSGLGHSVFLNTEGLKRAGYDLESPDQQGHRYYRRPDGQLTGEIAENAMEKFELQLPRPGPDHARQAMIIAIKELHKVGVTSVQEASANRIELTALQALEVEDALKIDIHAHIACRPLWLAKDPEEIIQETLEKAETFKSRHVHTNFAKFVLDGIPIPPLMTQCNLDHAGEVEEDKILVPDFAQLIEPLDRSGITCKVHCAGQGSTRRALDVFAKLRQTNPEGPRHEIAHSSAIHDDDLARLNELNVTAEMSPSNIFPIQKLIIPDGLAHWNFGRLMDLGTLVTIGSDYSSSDPSVFDPCAAVLEGVMTSKLITGDDIEQRKTQAAHALLRMITLSGAEAVGKADVSGSIEVGKKANFILVDRDLSKAEFEGAQVLETWFEGENVWRSDR